MKNEAHPGVILSIVPAEWTCHLAFALLALSYLSSDFLMLRGLAVAGALSNIAFQYFRPQPLYLPMKWNLMFLLINVIFVAGLLIEQQQATAALDSEPELQALFEHVFKPTGMSLIDFRRLIGLATWRDLQPGDTLCTEGVPSTRLFLVVRGKAAVVVRPTTPALATGSSSDMSGVSSTEGAALIQGDLSETESKAAAGSGDLRSAASRKVQSRLLGRAVRDRRTKADANANANVNAALASDSMSESGQTTDSSDPDRNNRDHDSARRQPEARLGLPLPRVEDLLVAVGGAGSFVSEMSFLRGFEHGWDDVTYAQGRAGMDISGDRSGDNARSAGV